MVIIIKVDLYGLVQVTTKKVGLLGLYGLVQVTTNEVCKHGG